jgi:hypothetical protein
MAGCASTYSHDLANISRVRIHPEEHAAVLRYDDDLYLIGGDPLVRAPPPEAFRRPLPLRWQSCRRADDSTGLDWKVTA